MKTIIEVEVLKVEAARGYDGQEPEHKSILTYKETKETDLGVEQVFKTLKSMLKPEEHKIGKGTFEAKLTPYLDKKSGRAVLSIKIQKQVK